LKEAELMTNRLQLLGAIDPYVGSYYSRAWIQRNVLRMNDDDIDLMDKEIDEEKAAGIGMPTDLTNQVAQQQMIGQVDAENQVAMAKAMPNDATGATSGGSSKSSSTSSSKPKPKSNPQPKGDLKLENETTFTKLKRIL
jgi:hypothetical protein